MTVYREEEFLLLSGLQHFSFCRRQWALIHIEQQWAENLRTVEGEIMHQRAHNADLSEMRDGVLYTRGMQVFSRTLGMSGACDVVEFHPAPDGIPLRGREGLYLPVPVEYKKGRPKEGDADRLQLCGQAICLEEMLACSIPQGYLYYGETRRRETVPFTGELRTAVTTMAEEMHQLYSRQYTPKVRPSKSCNACSLKDLCLPKLARKGSAAAYIRARLEEVTPCENC